MSETTEPIQDERSVELKRLNDMNLKALEEDIAEVFSKNVGGAFNVTVTKFEHARPDDFTNNRLILHISVEDEDWAGRLDVGK
jgi:hypothetical protein